MMLKTGKFTFESNEKESVRIRQEKELKQGQGEGRIKEWENFDLKKKKRTKGQFRVS